MVSFLAPISMDEILDSLNGAQREAVLHGDGPLLVLAGAGSGKTRIIVHRIARLVRDLRVAPWQILAVTFTNKAAGEMRERLLALLGAEAGELWASTFHAFGARFLRREARRAELPPDFAIYDDADQLALVKRISASAGWVDEEKLSPREVLSRIDRWKSHGLRPGDLSLDPYDLQGQAAAQIYRRYEEALPRAGAVDFGDLLLKPVRLLESDGELRSRWSGRFRHILVDEFQDTNRTQYRLLQLLAGERKNICVVGDDDQAIYRWRGAEVSNILDFDKDFPGTRVVKLEQNYRSTGRILEAAHAVISRASRRREKKLWTESPPGEPLSLLVGTDDREEAQRVAYALSQEHARGTPGQEVAVLYRVNAQSRPIEAALVGARIPYVVVRGTSFYERAEVKDAAAYLRLALSPGSDLDFARVVNRPARGFGEKSLQLLQAPAEARGVPLFEAAADPEVLAALKPAARKSLAGFCELIADLHRRVAGLEAAAVVQEVLQRGELISRLQSEGTEEADEKAANLLQLVSAAREFDEARATEPPPRDPEERGRAPLASFLEQIALLGDADGETPQGRVALMTLHAAKGLEFDVVFLVGLEEGMLPYARPWKREVSADELAADLDEERRLCYVGMTRARRRLVLSLARRRLGFGEIGPAFRDSEPSRFLGDLPRELFGLPAPAPRAPRIRHHPGALPGEPVIELDGDSPEPAPGPPAAFSRPGRGEPSVDYSFDQRPEEGQPAFSPGERVLHDAFGEGIVRSCDPPGPQSKATVAFFSVGEKRIYARFLRRG